MRAEQNRMHWLFPHLAFIIGPVFIVGGLLVDKAGESGGGYMEAAGATYMAVKGARRILHSIFDRNHIAIMRSGEAALAEQNRSFEMIAYGGRLVNRSELKALRKTGKLKGVHHHA